MAYIFTEAACLGCWSLALHGGVACTDSDAVIRLRLSCGERLANVEEAIALYLDSAAGASRNRVFYRAVEPKPL